MTAGQSGRVLGLWTCLALVVGNLIGSGVYLLPTNLAPAGWNAVIGWLVTIAGALCLAHVFARLSAHLPAAGGPYAYTRAAFGPGVGFAAAWSYWVMLWAGNGAIAVAVVSGLSVLFPTINQVAWLPGALAVGFVWLLTGVNIRGVKEAGAVQLVTTILKLLPLIAVVVLAATLLADKGTAALPPGPGTPISIGAVAGTAALAFWGFLGLESATVPADNVADPRRTIPRATLWGTAFTGVVYLLVCTAVSVLMPWQMAANSSAPVADFFRLHWGDDAARAVALFAAISAFGALNGFILLQGEMPWAMARGGVFPRWLGATSSRGTPVRAHLVSSVLLTIVTLMNYTASMGELFKDIASISLAAGMLAYLGCALAALKLQPHEPVLRVTGIATALFVGWMIYGLGWRADFWGMVLLLLGLPIYWWVRRFEGGVGEGAQI